MKQKQRIALFGAVAVALILMACGGDSGNNSSESEGDSSSSMSFSSSSQRLSSSSAVKSSSSSPVVSSSSVKSQSSSSVPLSSSVVVSSSSVKLQSSSSIPLSSSVEVCTNNYGTNTVTDCRDNQTYKTVVIGTQTWMAENLNYAVDSSWCYYNNSADNCTKYGRLYQWASAMDLDTVYNSSTWGGSDVNHQGICPDGWHLPGNDDWQTLYDYVDANNGDDEGVGTSLKSGSGWEVRSGVATGTNSFGFSVLPAGYRANSGNFYFARYYALFWSATEYNSDYANYWYLYYGGGGFYDGSHNSKYGGFSVRCLKDSV